MVLRNWVSFIKKQKGLFAILMFSQVMSLVCVLFVFGIFQNNLYELSANTDTKSLNASIRKGQPEREELTKVIKTLVDEYNFSIEYVYIDAYSVKGDYNYQDRVQYKEGHFSYSDSVFENVKGAVAGEMPQPIHYQNGEKVVVISPEIKKEIGQEVVLEGETYNVIGVNNVNGDGELEMPYISFPSKAKYDTFSIELTMLPTRTQYEQFCQELRAIGGECEEFYIQNNADRKREYSMIGISVLLALLAGGNMYMIYRYIFRKRRMQLAVYAICGCSRERTRRMFFTEIVLNMMLVLIFGVLIFRYVVYTFAKKWFRYLYMIYGIKEYMLICSIFVIVVLFMGYLLSRKMSKQTVVEMRKGENA